MMRVRWRLQKSGGLGTVVNAFLNRARWLRSLDGTIRSSRISHYAGGWNEAATAVCSLRCLLIAFSQWWRDAFPFFFHVGCNEAAIVPRRGRYQLQEVPSP